jgi:DNA-binding NarL/FixJ family response regulator
MASDGGAVRLNGASHPALALVGGATKASVAHRRRSQVSTVNTQVRSILAKTGAANLRDLERMLGCCLRGP